MEQTQELAQVVLLAAIVDRSRDEAVARICAEQGVHFHIAMLGRGTASSEILDCLGLGETDKAITLSLVTQGRVQAVRSALVEKLRMRSPGRGILFTVPLTALTGQLARQLSGQEWKGEEKAMERNPDGYGLILAMVNQGHSDDAMDAARAAGAGGGTLVHARRIGGGDAAQFLGISLQQERELVAILAKNETRSAIMKAIASAAGLGSPAQGIVLALPVDCIDGLA